MSTLDQVLDEFKPSSTVFFAVLNWGLGHATRSSVVIKRLLHRGHKVILGSDGAAATYLAQMWPTCELVPLPPYNVSYAHASMMRNMLEQAPGIYTAIRREHRSTALVVEQYGIDEIISDNRYGCYHTAVRSSILTHQLRVVGKPWWATRLASYLIRKQLSSFDTIWVPDDDARLSGLLSSSTDHRVRRVGVLSILDAPLVTKDIDITVLLSGPEPQRSILEHMLCDVLRTVSGVIHIVRGTTKARSSHHDDRLVVHDYLVGSELAALLQRSRCVVCRSGYSSVMDLHSLQLPAILIPTPGQPEQEYLAGYLATHYASQYGYIQQAAIREQLLQQLERFTTYGSQDDLAGQ